MTKRWLIALTLVLAGPSLAAAKQRQLTLAAPGDALPQPLETFAQPSPRERFQPAPLPNRDLAGPSVPRASNEPTVAPTLFSSHERYRGDGFSRGSSAQGEQERNMKPPVGFSLHMPFTPQ